MSDSDDRRRVQRAALSIGLYVGIASAIVIAGGVGIVVGTILLNRRPESGEPAEPGEPPGGFPEEHGGRGDDFVVDVDRVLPVVIVLGLIGVVLLGVIAWLAARRSVRPLGDALRLQRNFVADASHELRTPLTALTSRIQVVQRRHDRGEPIGDALVELRADAALMTDVLNDLLLAAEGEGDRTGPTSVAQAVGAALASLRPIAADAGVTLTADIQRDGTVALPAVTLVRLIVALADNAVQHSPSCGEVKVRAGIEGHDAVIRVIDEGGGIRGISPDAVFERFSRSAESGRRRGFGLGLSLVREVATRSGGGVAVETTSDAGTTFVLRLPLAR